MPVFNTQQITEINTLIAAIEKVIKPKFEIGARDKTFITSVLKANKVTKKPLYFSCKREYSDFIVSHFVKENGVAKSRFNMNNQSCIFLLT